MKVIDKIQVVNASNGGVNIVTLVYTYNEVDDATGQLLRQGIRKSTQVLEADVEQLQAVQILKDFALSKEI